MRFSQYLIDASVVNSYILYQTGASTKFKPKSHLVFRSTVAIQMIGNFTTRKSQRFWLIIRKNKTKKIDGRSINTDNTIRMTNIGEHLPTHMTSRRYARCT
jgi:hypothetical protein